MLRETNLPERYKYNAAFDKRFNKKGAWSSSKILLLN